MPGLGHARRRGARRRGAARRAAAPPTAAELAARAPLRARLRARLARDSARASMSSSTTPRDSPSTRRPLGAASRRRPRRPRRRRDTRASRARVGGVDRRVRRGGSPSGSSSWGGSPCGGSPCCAPLRPSEPLSSRHVQCDSHICLHTPAQVQVPGRGGAGLTRGRRRPLVGSRGRRPVSAAVSACASWASVRSRARAVLRI